MKIFFLLITFLSYSLLLSMEIINKETIINYMRNAKQAEKNNNLQETFQWYGKAADVYLPPSPNYEELNISSDDYEQISNPFVTQKDPHIVQRRCKERAFSKITQKACDLKNQGKFKEALAIYQYAPQSFSNQIRALQMLLNHQATKQLKILEPVEIAIPKEPPQT